MIPFQGSYTKEILRRATREMMARFRLMPWFSGLALAASVFGVVVVPIRHGEPAGQVILTALRPAPGSKPGRPSRRAGGSS